MGTALLALSCMELQTQQSLAQCPPTCGIAYTVDSTGDGHNVGFVTQCNDGTGHCTLRAAIEAANGHAGLDGIFFEIPTAGNNCDASGNCTINLGTALQDLTEGVTISGPGADKLTVKRSTVNGTPQFRIFNVTTTGTVSFSGLTIADGIVFGNGGGIQNVNAGTVNVTNSTLLGNKVLSGSNNSDFVGGGIYNNSTGTINVTNSSLTSNVVTPSGTNNLSAGGGIFNAGTANIINSTLNGNRAETSNGSAIGGGIYNGGTVNLTNSTLLNNSTGPITNGQSFTVNASGGGIFNDTGTVNVTNCTLSSNSAFAAGSASARGGGIFNSTGTVNLTNSTLSSNSCSGFPSPTMIGGGIFNLAGLVNVKSTIIALSTVTTGDGTVGSNPDASGTFASQGFNLIGKRDGTSTSFTTDPTDQTGTVAAPRDPKFETDSNGRPLLKNNGGPTLTIALLFGSPAIDKGTSQCLTCGSTGVLTTDQRGTGFQRTFNDPAIPPATGGDNTDIGAFEVQTTPPPPPTPTATPTATPGSLGNVSTRLQVGTGDNVLFAGFIIQGNASKTVLIRSAGPSLTSFGVPGALGNPRLELHDPNSTLGTNDNWQTTHLGGVITSDQVAAIQNSGETPRDPAEPAIIATLPAGGYTAIVQGVGGAQGVATVEVYDLSPNNGAILANISTRGFIQTGDNVMIGGFIVVGQTSRVLIRATGPSLIPFGINNALANPRLELHDGNGTLAGNDDWQTTQLGGIIISDQSAAIQNSGFAPGNPAESAIIATLAPGAYTAIAQGVNGGTGVGLIEVFALP